MVPLFRLIGSIQEVDLVNFDLVVISQPKKDWVFKSALRQLVFFKKEINLTFETLSHVRSRVKEIAKLKLIGIFLGLFCFDLGFALRIYFLFFRLFFFSRLLYISNLINGFAFFVFYGYVWLLKFVQKSGLIFCGTPSKRGFFGAKC